MALTKKQWAACIAPVLMLAGCGSKPDDKNIVKQIQTDIRKDTAIEGEVSAESAEGMVTLRGHVANDAARALAARDAAAVAGVRGVVNVLTIGPSDAASSAKDARPRNTRTAAREASAPSRETAARNPRGARASGRSEPVAAPSQPEFRPAPPVVASAPALAETAAVAAPPPPPSLPPPPPPPVKLKVSAGASISVRLIDSVDSTRNKAGDTFRATLSAPIRVDGETAIPAGASVEGRVVDASNAGRFSGHSELRLELTKLVSNGATYPLQTEANDKAGNGRGKGTAETVGAGAALGAIIGAVAGGGKGAGIGTLAGAGAGGATRGVQSRQRIYYPSETVLSFRLQEGFTVVEKGGASKDADDSRPVLRR